MPEHTAARTPAALAELLGLTVPQLARVLAENLPKLDAPKVPVFNFATGTLTAAENLTRAEVLGVLAAGVLSLSGTPRPAARSPLALAEHLGLTVPQLAQRLASLTQTEGMTGAGLTLDSEHLTAAEVLGVLAATPSAAQPEPVPPSNLCPACRGQGEHWAAPYYNPRECPECEGRGVLDVYTPDGPPAAEVEP